MAATQWQDKLAGYSNSGVRLDIAAPGSTCYSNTTPEGVHLQRVPERRVQPAPGHVDGGAAVTGAAGTVAAVTGLRGSARRTRLVSTTDNSGSAASFGAGRLNLDRAVTSSSRPVGQ